MSEWQVFGVVAALVAFAVAVGTPIIRLNTNITRLNVTLENIAKQQDKQEAVNNSDHAAMWDELGKHDGRLTKLERGDGHGR